MEKEVIENQVQFIEEIFIKNIGRLQKEGFYIFSFILIGQAIESMGGFLDNKPMKARGQATKRFSKGLNRIMGHRYRLINENHWFYDKFRNQLTHAFTSSKDLLLISENKNKDEMKHLCVYNKQLVLIAEEFYSDFKRGCDKFINDLRQDRIKPTKINMDWKQD